MSPNIEQDIAPVVGERCDVSTAEELACGQFGRNAAGEWFAMPPVVGTDGPIYIGDYNRTEHEDGTISIHQRITLPSPEGTFAWTLERGIWKVAL